MKQQTTKSLKTIQIQNWLTAIVSFFTLHSSIVTYIHSTYIVFHFLVRLFTFCFVTFWLINMRKLELSELTKIMKSISFKYIVLMSWLQHQQQYHHPSPARANKPSQGNGFHHLIETGFSKVNSLPRIMITFIRMNLAVL